MRDDPVLPGTRGTETGGFTDIPDSMQPKESSYKASVTAGTLSYDTQHQQQLKMKEEQVDQDLPLWDNQYLINRGQSEHHPEYRDDTEPGEKIIALPSRIITTSELYEHNRGKENQLWFQWRGYVYDVEQIKKALDAMEVFTAMRPLKRRPSAMARVMYVLEHLGLIPSPHRKDKALLNGENNNKTIGHPEIMAIVADNTVGRLNTLTPEEMTQSVHTQLKEFLVKYESDCLNRNHHEQPNQLLVTILGRNVDSLHSLHSRLCKNRSGRPIDLNDLLFLPPPDVCPEELTEHRTFSMITTFDDDVGPISGYPGEPAWQWEHIDSVQIHDDFVNYLSESHGNEPFDTTIAEGQVVWDELPLDVIKNDVVLPSQEIIFQRRVSCVGMSQGRMEKRHEQHLLSFQAKYSLSREQIEPYKPWCNCLQDSWVIFQKLC